MSAALALREAAAALQGREWTPSVELAMSLVNAAEAAVLEDGSPSRALDVRNGLTVAEHLFKLRGAQLIESNLVVAQRIRTEWALGRELPARLSKAPGNKRNMSVDTTCSTLSGMGLSRDQSAAFQQLAQIERDDLEAAIAESLNAEELSTAWALRLYQMQCQANSPDLNATPPPDGCFPTLVADPPWQYENIATRGAAEDHYPTLSLDQLCGRAALPDGQNLVADVVQPRLSENAHLYLWATSPLLPDAFKVLEAWGFTYKTSLVWVKPQPGIGNYFRSQHELVLFGVRGRLPVLDKSQPSWFEAKRTRHSQKPERLYEMVEKASPPPYLELFARPLPLLGPRPSWFLWGNEA